MAAMNNVPAITEEQRQELIDFMQGSRTYRYEEWSRLSKLRDQITLAALTAEPEVWIKPDSLGFPRLAGIDAVTIPYVPEYPIPLYTAPPAPVLRLPGEVSCEGLDPQEADEARNLGQCEGWNQCLSEIKSLNNQPAPPEASNEQ
ncbi:hypothetical protein PQD17_gp35 [Pantoea phage PdC23]|uniref:Uncharacterized protein n=1 Tax=Pantoea phage PdC23 TaxID=2894356 RepID=A0AAE8YIQ3_9CAUD|nr:hypothetical protein PQD17_gp35 [Pantoea phage PdC23]UGC97748.1 hypothetical protein pdc_035 [Pantoea phage PdC23]